MRGQPTSEAVEGTAAVLDKSETGAVYDAIGKRYGIVGKVFNFFSKLRGGMENNVGLELKVVPLMVATRSPADALRSRWHRPDPDPGPRLRPDGGRGQLARLDRATVIGWSSPPKAAHPGWPTTSW